MVVLQQFGMFLKQFQKYRIFFPRKLLQAKIPSDFFLTCFLCNFPIGIDQTPLPNLPNSQKNMIDSGNIESENTCTSSPKTTKNSSNNQQSNHTGVTLYRAQNKISNTKTFIEILKIHFANLFL